MCMYLLELSNSLIDRFCMMWRISIPGRVVGKVGRKILLDLD